MLVVMLVVMFAPGRFLLASLAATCWIPVFACWWPRPVLSSLSSLCWCRHHKIVGIKRKPGNRVPNHFLAKLGKLQEIKENNYHHIRNIVLEMYLIQVWSDSSTRCTLAQFTVSWMKMVLELPSWNHWHFSPFLDQWTDLPSLQKSMKSWLWIIFLYLEVDSFSDWGRNTRGCHTSVQEI